MYLIGTASKLSHELAVCAPRRIYAP